MLLLPGDHGLARLDSVPATDDPTEDLRAARRLTEALWLIPASHTVEATRTRKTRSDTRAADTDRSADPTA